MRKTEVRDAKRSAIAGDAPSRPRLRERTRYEPNLPQEEFIVPLLRREIEFCIANYATPARGAAKAVDIGCGGQPFRELLQQIGYSYCGVDVNPEGRPSVDVLWAADEPLPEELVRRGPFDFLLCTEVIEHVADWQAAFANFGLLLAPSGRALITAPFFYQPHEEPYDFWRPTIHAIDYYARRTGLNALYRQAAGDVWDVLGTMLATCKFLPSSARLADHLLAKAIRVASRLMCRAILRGVLQPRVRAEAPLYLSNVFVLEKPKGE
jgi:SAM-dependent methyltransferase